MSRPLHIGVLTPAYAGVTDWDSGIGVHFRHLADALTAAGHRVTVLLVTDRAPSPAQGIPAHVRLVVAHSRLASLVGRLNWQCHQWATLRAAFARARHASAEIPVDVWEATSTGSLPLRFLQMTQRAPVAVRVSTTAAQLRVTNAGPDCWVQRRMEAWEDLTVRRADRVLTHSSSHRAAIAGQFRLPLEDIAVIPHGIAVPPAVTCTTSAQRCRILFVGRLEQRKGIDLLLAALPNVLHQVPHAMVSVVGYDRDGYWEQQWLKQAPAEHLARVQFAGRVSAAALDEHYRGADIFVAPSRYESFGLIFVEAMARSLPVVSLRAPGASDLIEHDRTGVLVQPEDAAALASALIDLSADPGRATRLGAAARAAVEAKYSLPALATASVAFYRQMIESRDGHRRGAT